MGEDVVRVRDSLRAEIRGGNTYGKIAAQLKISKGVLWKFLNKDYSPKNPVIRKRLGLEQGTDIIIQAVRRNGKGRFEPIEQDQENES